MPNANHAQAGQQSRSDQCTMSEVLGLLRTLNVKVEDLRALFAHRRKANLTVDEFADAVGRSSYTIRRWVSEEKINAIRVQGTGPRGRLLIPREELERLIAAGHGANVPDAAVGHIPEVPNK